MLNRQPLSNPKRDDASPTIEAESAYGPVRRRLHTKAGPMSVFRPGRMATDDFQDMMRVYP